MILDGHIHVRSLNDTKENLLPVMEKAGIDGGILISALPDNMIAQSAPNEARLTHVLKLCEGESHFYPFYFLNPVAEDALEQVDFAVEKGIAGFKIICNTFYPSDPRCVETYHHIASYRKPLLFHSGILWDGQNASGNYNKPTEFEILLKISGLRFSLAHISWPWCDECIAVYGKFNHAVKTKKQVGAEMFIDNTPGTPKIYRKDALSKLLLTGYDVVDNIIFGSDNNTSDYNSAWIKDWIQTDQLIYRELGLSDGQIENIFANNLMRFIHG